MESRFLKNNDSYMHYTFINIIVRLLEKKKKKEKSKLRDISKNDSQVRW